MTVTVTDRRALVWPCGSLRSDPFSVQLTPRVAGWSRASLRVLELEQGSKVRFATGAEEMLVVPLRGGCTVCLGDDEVRIAGRNDVFAGPTDFAYLPREASVEIASALGGRFALPGARCERELGFRYSPADVAAVELRGAGACSRQVHSFCMPDTFEADRLIACEVLTPGGNWSSFPPHKHDENTELETALEEIYYFEVATGRGGSGFGFQRVYGSPSRPIDVLAEVRSGDVVLVPHGWHGPSIAAPGYDLYYLNVMAGDGTRAWRACDDPQHQWVRETWSAEAVDARLPFGARESVS
jgi:5-deoxy-glucuronate isomerase